MTEPKTLHRLWCRRCRSWKRTFLCNETPAFWCPKHPEEELELILWDGAP